MVGMGFGGEKGELEGRGLKEGGGWVGICHGNSSIERGLLRLHLHGS